MAKMLRYGMVGGGPDAFIGDAHRRAIALDSTAMLVAGAFSRSAEKSKQMAETLHLDEARCYADYQTMAQEEAKREDGIDFVVVVTPNHSHYTIRALMDSHRRSTPASRKRCSSGQLRK